MYLFKGNNRYDEYNYANKEDELEKDVISNSKILFGNDTIYIDEKRNLTNEFRRGNSQSTIPDGYLIDFTFNKPTFYFVEVETSDHDVKDHINPQLFQFYINFDYNKNKIIDFINEYIDRNNYNVDKYVKKYNYRNFDHLLKDMLEKEISIYLIIDDVSPELEKYVAGYKFYTQIIEFKKYKYKNDELFRFEPTNIEYSVPNKNDLINIDDLDTVIVSAYQEGFEEVFIKENCWHEIYIGKQMLNRLKYIVAYQVTPIKSLTYYAEIDSIEKYKDTNKYIIYFKDKAKPLKKPIPLKNPNKAPQGRVYTNSKKIFNCKIDATIDDIL